MERRNDVLGNTNNCVAHLFTSKTYAQSEPDIISAVAAHYAKRGIGANGLTQKNAFHADRILHGLSCDKMRTE
jgi:hypothetical protein